MHHSSSNKSNEYGKAQALFAKLKNEDEVVATSLLHAYLKEQGMSDEWADRALKIIDVNQDNELTWAEFATKGIRIIDQLRLHEESVLKTKQAKENGANGELEKTVIDASEVFVSAQLPNGENVAVLETSETTVEKLPNGDVLVEQTVDTVIVEDDSAAKERQKELERQAIAAAFFEQTKAQVIQEATEEKQKKFALGEQPNWAGTDACVPQPPSYVPSVIQEGINSLNKRGYAILPLPTEITDLYSDFHAAFEAFSQSSLDHKKQYATQQFDSHQHSPNQFHGFSVVQGLKEQFMMRVCGKGTLLTTPGTYHTGHYSSTEDLGKVGMKLYEELDQICRKVAHEAVKKLGIHASKVDILLDPVHHTGKPVERDPAHPDVSSSIMDNFHYYNTFDNPVANEDKGERFYNNHSAHTDSGLLTVVITTDEPGLEVYDQQLKQWIALEQHLHEFATIFWADSVSYLKAPGLQPCLHRVGKSTKERYSVVFKQRTSTLTTPPRYQEDYILADIQKRTTQHLTSKGFTFFARHPLFLGAFAMAIAIGVGAYLGRPKIL